MRLHRLNDTYSGPHDVAPLAVLSNHFRAGRLDDLHAIYAQSELRSVPHRELKSIMAGRASEMNHFQLDNGAGGTHLVEAIPRQKPRRCKGRGRGQERKQIFHHATTLARQASFPIPSGHVAALPFPLQPTPELRQAS